MNQKLIFEQAPWIPWNFQKFGPNLGIDLKNSFIHVIKGEHIQKIYIQPFPWNLWVNILCLVIFRSKNMCLKEYLTWSSTVRRQYDPLIIERTIGLVFGPCTALYRPFLKHCTLTNKAVWTIWRALSKPPQRRQGPDLRPLWLLVRTSFSHQTWARFQPGRA